MALEQGHTAFDIGQGLVDTTNLCTDLIIGHPYGCQRAAGVAQRIEVAGTFRG
jgi:hypothetical protein